MNLYNKVKVHNTLCDEVLGGLVDDAGLHYQEARLEGLRAPNSLVIEGDDLAVGSLHDFSRKKEPVAVDVSCSRSRAR